MLKRTLSIILAVAMLVTLVPAYALATEGAGGAGGVGGGAGSTGNAAVNGFDTSKLIDGNGVKQPVGITIPDYILNYNVTNSDDAATNPTVNDLPQEGLTYLLVDSNVATKSNFTTDYSGSFTNAGSDYHAWLSGSGVKIRRPNDDTNLSEHVAKIYVPGTESKTFQVVTQNIRTAYSDSRPSRYASSGKPSQRGMLVWVDDKPVAADISKGHDVISNIQHHKVWIDNGFVNWNADGSVYYIWEWGPTVTLEPGVHEIKFMPYGGSDGGRVPGLILTEAVGYDWTKISPFPTKSYKFGDQYANIQADFAASFIAAGYMDFIAPEFNGDVVVDSVSATTLVFTVPTATDRAESVIGGGVSKYIDSAYDEILYTVKVNGEEVTPVNGVVTIENLYPGTKCDVVVEAMDMVGNTTTLNKSIYTTGADQLDYAYFEKGAKISNITTLADLDNAIELEWDAAVPGTLNSAAQPVVTYNVYVNGTLKVEKTAATTCKIEGLSKDTEYEIKIVTVTNDNEAAAEDVYSSLELTTYTARDPEVSEVVSETTSTSTVLEFSSKSEPAAFTFAVTKLLVNGVEITENINVNGNKVTINGLIPGVANSIKISTRETHKTSGEYYDCEYDLFTVTTPASEGFTLTEDMCIPSSGLPMPLCYDTLYDAGKWPIDSANGAGGGLWPKEQLWRGDKGTVQTTIKIENAGKYYAYSQMQQYFSDRYVTATINGSAIAKQDGSAFLFGKENVVTGGQQVELSVCPAPVTLPAGEINVKLAATGGATRLNFFAFIPVEYAYDANGNLLVEGSEYESIRKFIRDTFGIEDSVTENGDGTEARNKFMNFYLPPEILTEKSLSSTTLAEDTVVVQWKPTVAAVGEYVTYEVYCDGVKKGEVTETQAPQFVFEDLAPGQHTVKVVANHDGAKYQQEITVYAAAIATQLVVNPEETGNGLQSLDNVTIKLNNVRDEEIILNVLVATFENNQMVKVEPVKEIKLSYGSKNETYNFTKIENTKVVGQNAAIDATAKNTKIFIIDANGFVPYMCEY